MSSVPVAPVGDLVQGEPGGQQGADQRDGEAGGLGRQRGGARRARVDLDDDHAAGLGVVGELDVGAADHLDGFHDPVGVLLQLRLQLRGDGEHGGGAVGVAGVHAHGVHVLDEADGDHLVLGVAHHLELQLFPAQHRFLDQHLADQAGGDAARRDRAQLLHVVDQAAAGAAHGVGRADDHRVAQLGGNGLGLLHAVGGLALGHLDAQAGHGLLEGEPVLAALDGVEAHADDLDAVLVQDPGAVPARSERFSPDWPPRLGSSASGRSLAMISVSVSTFSGSM